MSPLDVLWSESRTSPTVGSMSSCIGLRLKEPLYLFRGTSHVKRHERVTSHVTDESSCIKGLGIRVWGLGIRV